MRFCSANASSGPSLSSGFAPRISYRLTMKVSFCRMKKRGTSIGAVMIDESVTAAPTEIVLASLFAGSGHLRLDHAMPAGRTVSGAPSRQGAVRGSHAAAW